MNDHDFVKLSYKQLLEWFERERQEWLAAGMSEAAIHLMHFGTKDEKGRGGDYRMWLDERKYTRADHKYAPGSLILTDMDTVDNERVNGGQSEFTDADSKMDFETALLSLTESQKFCFVSVALNGRTQQSVADELGIRQQNVDKHIRAARKKLKKYFR
jgi:RNA polymerase sigma factor (sigma-70 family)